MQDWQILQGSIMDSFSSRLWVNTIKSKFVIHFSDESEQDIKKTTIIDMSLSSFATFFYWPQLTFSIILRVLKVIYKSLGTV